MLELEQQRVAAAESASAAIQQSEQRSADAATVEELRAEVEALKAQLAEACLQAEAAAEAAALQTERQAVSAPLTAEVPSFFIQLCRIPRPTLIAPVPSFIRVFP